MQFTVSVKCSICGEEVKAEWLEVYSELHVVPCECELEKKEAALLGKVLDHGKRLTEVFLQKLSDDLDSLGG